MELLSGLPPKLIWHTLVAAVIVGFGIAAPLLLLLRSQLGVVATLAGIFLLAVGACSILASILTRCFNQSDCSRLQWRLIVFSAWALNPALFAAALRVPQFFGFQPPYFMEASWWSSIPLMGVLVLLSGRLRLADGDPDWVAGGCPFNGALAIHWFFSRFVFIGLPMCLVSFQVALYLPDKNMLPNGVQIGLFVCGGCVIISGKFCTMCACLAHTRISQAFILALMLAADWISSLHLMGLVQNNEIRITLLLCFLLVAGVVQTRVALERLQLRRRWSRVRSIQDTELSAQMTTPTGESSDSDDERGPGSLPEGFHQALAAILGFGNTQTQNARRQFICGPRTAMVRAPPVSPPSVEGGPTPASRTTAGPGTGGSLLTDGAGPGQVSPNPGLFAALEITAEERICTVCQDEIRTGDTVRPMPKCKHVFHGACIEQWIRQKREETQCPTCRRPALSRRQGQDGVLISQLSAPDEQTASGSYPSWPGSLSGSGAERLERPGPRPPRSNPPLGRPPQRWPLTRVSVASGVESLRQMQLPFHDLLLHAALEVARGDTSHAIDLLFSQREMLEHLLPRGAFPPAVPPGVVEAVVQANEELRGAEVQLRRQLAHLYESGLLRRVPWSELPDSGRLEVFRALLTDLLRRQQARLPTIATGPAGI